MTLQISRPPPADPSGRAKLVWGRTGILAAVACLTLVLAANTFAGDKPSRHAHPGPKVKPGHVNSQVKAYAVDDEVTSRVRKGKANDTVNLLVTELPGRDLPARFKKYVHGDRLTLIDGYQLDNVPVGLVSKISADESTNHVHFNRPATKHDALSTSAAHANAVDPSHLINQQLFSYTGQGVRVAILDSGFSSYTKQDLADSRISFVSFVDGNQLRHDGDGHGTHVAGIIGGTGAGSARYAGIAPGVKIVSLKVLDDNGAGTIGNIIAGLSWIANHPEYNIRVVNMSVGAAVHESYWTDPLTLATKTLVDRGITVVAAAGNRGKNADGKLQWGGIVSPGNAPWVLTVCAFSTQGTYNTSDDAMAGFSSSGPSAVDFGAKPDICAPGAGIVSLADYGSTLYRSGFFSTPTTLVGGIVGNLFSRAPYESLSGTSMAAPFVSGAIALMLEANPNLTPNLIKAILQYTATFQPGVSPLRQGAGFMNVNGAVKLAAAYAVLPQTTWQSTMSLRTLIPASWSKRIIWGNHMLTGGVMDPSANAWKPGVEWGSAKTQMSAGENIVWGTALSDENIVWGTALSDENIVWGTAAADENIVWGTDCSGADCDLVWGAASADENIVWGTALAGENIVWGTAAADENIVWGTAAEDENIVWGTAADEDLIWPLDTLDGPLDIIEGGN